MTARLHPAEPELPDGYRPNAGAVLIDRRGLVFAGRRSDRTPPAWQMPQGGVDAGEAIIDAALRELEEETGVGSSLVDVLGVTPEWFTYDLPPAIADRLWKGRYRGQAQRWVACRFIGDDADIDLAGAADDEFDAWQWMKASDLAAVVIDFKRPVYRHVFEQFSAHLAS